MEEATMTLYANDDFLTTIAIHARLVYSQQQTQQCRAALARWQTHALVAGGAWEHARIQYELAYHTKQLDRWQTYLDRLRDSSVRDEINVGSP
jgi:hypothetical protein